MTAPSSGDITDAVIARLATTGLDVVDGHLDGPVPAAGRWLTVQQTPGRWGDDGTLGDPHDSGFASFLVRAAGASRAEAEWVADQARASLLETPMTLSGRVVLQVELDVAGQHLTDTDTDPATHLSIDRWRVWVAG